MVEYSKIRVELTDTQLLLKIMKTAIKNNAGTTLRMSLKMFNGDNLSRELLLKQQGQKRS